MLQYKLSTIACYSTPPRYKYKWVVNEYRYTWQFSGQKNVSIKNVQDLHSKNQESNFTNEFESPDHIVLRRGNTFEFIVDVSSLADMKEDSVTFELHRGYRARYTRGTMFQGACSIKSKRYYQWEMKVHNYYFCLLRILLFCLLKERSLLLF